MVGSEIELGPSDSRWLTTNILIHDLCHDFNVSTMKQRMSKLNSLFKSFSDKFPIVNDKIPIKNPMLTGGVLMKRKRTLMQELGNEAKRIATASRPEVTTLLKNENATSTSEEADDRSDSGDGKIALQESDQQPIKPSQPAARPATEPPMPQSFFVSTVKKLALWRLNELEKLRKQEEKAAPPPETEPMEENSSLKADIDSLPYTTASPKNKKITLFVFFKFIEEIQKNFLKNKNTNLISSIINFDNNILIKDVLNYHFIHNIDGYDLDDYILDEYILDDIEEGFFKDAKSFYDPYYEDIISTLKILKKSYALDPYEENNSIKYSFFLLMLLTEKEAIPGEVNDMVDEIPESISVFLYFIKELDHYIDYIKLYFISHIDLEEKPLFEENQLNEIIKIGSHILTSLYDDNYANAGTTYDVNKIFDKLKKKPARRIEVPSVEPVTRRVDNWMNGGNDDPTITETYKTLLGKIKKINIEERYAAKCNEIIDKLLPKKKKLIKLEEVDLNENEKWPPWREKEAWDKHMSAILEKIGFDESDVEEALFRNPPPRHRRLHENLEFIPFFYYHILEDFDSPGILESAGGKKVLDDIRDINIIRLRLNKIWNAIVNYKNVLDESFEKLKEEIYSLGMSGEGWRGRRVWSLDLEQFNTRIYRTIRMRVKNSLDDILKYMKMFLTSLRIQLEKKIPKQPREPNGGPLEVTAVPIVNNLLTVITKRVLEITDGGYSEDVNHGKKGIFLETSRKILKDIENTGRVPTTHDKNLLNAFKNFERPTSPTTPKEILEIFTNYHKFINNSMGTKDPEDPGKKIVKNHDGQKLCLLPSLLDAQGTFGSCTSKDYENAEHDILLKAGNEEEGYLFEFNFNIKGTQKGKCIANYYLIYNNPYGGMNSDDTDAGEGLTLYNCNITTNLGPDSSKQDKNIISANNTLKLLLNHIELVFYQQPNPPTWKIFENTEYLVELLKKSSRKMIGDFGQELVSIADDAGFIEVKKYNKVMDKKESIVLANGDRPSAVRAAFIMKNAISPLKHKRGILYGADKLLLLWEHDLYNKTGGNLKNKKQIITHKKLKTKKHSKKKNKQKINTRKKIKKTKKYKKKTKNKK